MRVNKLVSRLGVGVFLATLVTLAANPAYAAPKNKTSDTQTENPFDAVSFRSCSGSGYDISGKVTGTTDCEISTKFDQDFINEGTVNKEGGFFDYTDWNFGGKIGSNAGYNGTQGGQSGSWDISQAIQYNWDEIMLVFKSGNGTNLVGYMVEDGVKSGTWESPYEKSAFDFNGNNIKDVSHISVYYREGNKQFAIARKVPEPTSILGLIAISGLAASSLKRKRKSQISN